MKESGIEGGIVQYLCYMGWFAWRTHTAKYPPCEKGVPDILGVKDGQIIAVEVKKPGQKPSAVQKDFLDKLLSYGALAFVATSVADVQKVLGK